jgi:hypothetical protein
MNRTEFTRNWYECCHLPTLHSRRGTWTTCTTSAHLLRRFSGRCHLPSGNVSVTITTHLLWKSSGRCHLQSGIVPVPVSCLNPAMNDLVSVPQLCLTVLSIMTSTPSYYSWINIYKQFSFNVTAHSFLSTFDELLCHLTVQHEVP